MTAARFSLAFALASLLVAATPRGAGTTGYVNLPRAVESNPLHAVLAQYDREISALRSTLRISGLADLSTQADRGAATLRALASSASPHARYASRAGANERREPATLGAVAGAPQRAELQAYASDLARETKATLAAYTQSIAQRNARALAARVQQLHEKEITLAFDLARGHAGKRLALRLKLDDLHLDRADRARLTSDLVALNAGESSAVAAMRRTDGAILSKYAARLRSDGTAQIATMSAQLRAKEAANLELRRRVLQVDQAQIAAFRSSYRASSDAADIAAGMESAGADISRRFAGLAQSDRGSARETIAQIRTLQANRTALYRAIVAQIVREARALARARGLNGVAVTGPPARGSVDLTADVRRRLADF